MTQKFKFIHEFIEILENLNIEYWLEGGTALAAYRDGEIFPWEHDFDIGVLKQDFDKKIDIFFTRMKIINCKIKIQKNYPFIDNIIQIYSNNEHADPNQIDIYLYTEKNKNIYMRWLNSPIGPGSNIVKSILFLSSKKLRYTNKNNKIKIFFIKMIFNLFLLINYNFFKSTYHSFPKKFFKNRKKIYFCNKDFYLPYMIDDFLVYRYGKNWKYPDKNFNQEGKWKLSKARPILSQKYLPYPKINYSLYDLIQNVNKKN